MSNSTKKIYVCYTVNYAEGCEWKDIMIAFKHEIQAKDWVSAKKQAMANLWELEKQLLSNKEWTTVGDRQALDEYRTKTNLVSADDFDYEEIELLS